MVQTPVIFDTAHEGAIHDAQLDFYSRILATAAHDGLVRLWNVSEDSPTFIAELNAHHAPVWQLSWSHPKFQNLLASCSYDHAIYIWKEVAPQTWSIIHASKEHTSSVNSVAFSPEEFGLNLAAASSDGTVSILSYRLDTATWSRKVLQAHLGGALTVSWIGSAHSTNRNTLTPHQKKIVTGGCDNQIRVWMFVDSTEEWVLACNINSEKLHTRWIRDVAWSCASNGQPLIASCSEDGNVVIWSESDNQNWKGKQVIALKQPVWKVSWSITGDILAVTFGIQNVRLYKENINGIWEELQTPEVQALKLAANGYEMPDQPQTAAVAAEEE